MRRPDAVPMVVGTQLDHLRRRRLALGAPLAFGLAWASLSGCASPPAESPNPSPKPSADAAAAPTDKPAFSIVDVDIRDGKAFGEYVVGHTATLAAAGGKFLVAGARGEAIEGSRVPRTMVIHEWPSMQAFHAWYDGPAYAPWRAKRWAVSSADVILVQGIAPSAPSATVSPAYSVVDIEVRDPQVFGRYVQGHTATLQAAGGSFLAAGSRIEVIEGAWSPKRVILHRWPDVQAFRTWYASEAYRPWRELRHSVSSANVELVAGLSEAQKTQRKLP